VLQELLQRVSSLPVVQAADGMRAAPGVVYVIPPNRELELFDGGLLLSPPSLPRGQRMAVDTFFRSLALDQGDRAVGVVLSGTGSDGSLGLRAIHAAGGLCLVQDPATAKFGGMPASALRTGVPALVAAAEQLPGVLARSILGLGSTATLPPAMAAAMARILKVLRTQTGGDFSLYKRSSIRRRVERRMAANAIDDLDTYARYLQENAVERKALYRDLLINVTSFFRDPEAFAALSASVLPGLLEGKAAGETVRVWVAGCASGEEAYSIAILLRELLEETHRDLRVQIYGTDLDADAVAAARVGIFPARIAGDLTPERLKRFFVKEAAGYRIKKEIREQVVFAVQDLVKDPPFTRLDLVSCRNVFIYMEPELQDRLLSLFHYALRPGGALFLSPAEGIGTRTELFEPLDRKWRLFKAKATSAAARTALRAGLSWVKSPAASEIMPRTPEADGAELTRRALLQSYAPVSVLTDLEGTILYVHGDTGPYLRPAPGQATLNVVAMARENLQLDLLATLHQVASKGRLVRRTGLQLKAGARTLAFSVVVRPLPLPRGGQRLLLVSFEEEKGPARGKAAGRGAARSGEAGRVQELRRALAATRESLQATVEEHQTSREELQSTNEELQSTNEEVQASNEELETAKEELQSVNEELTTVNAELQAKVEQLSAAQDDLKNVFDAIRVGTVFLDEQMRVKRFSREACRVFRLVESDVGRSLADIKSSLVDCDLLPDAEAVLSSLAPIEREVRATDGACYLARLLPYRTLDNVIRGVVLSFLDITSRVEAETAAQAQRALSESIVDTVREPLVVLDGDLKVVSASRSFHAAFGTSPASTLGRPFYEVAGRRWDIPRLRELLETILPRDQAFEDFEVGPAASDADQRVMRLNARRLRSPAGGRPLILLAFEP
jgi:two-component system CheB/CheR fusion protein